MEWDSRRNPPCHPLYIPSNSPLAAPAAGVRIVEAGKHLLLTNCYNQSRWYPEEGSSGKMRVAFPGLAMRKADALRSSRRLVCRDAGRD